MGASGIPWTTATTDELGGYAEFLQLSPCPERMILTVSLPHVFEGDWMLPKIPFLKQNTVTDVPTSPQPIHNLLGGCDLDLAGAFQVPRPIVQVGSPELLEGDRFLGSSPHIIIRQVTSGSAKDRLQDRADHSLDYVTPHIFHLDLTSNIRLDAIAE